jgi:hypothetical protein
MNVSMLRCTEEVYAPCVTIGVATFRRKIAVYCDCVQ